MMREPLLAIQLVMLLAPQLGLLLVLSWVLLSAMQLGQ
jgi:hypothetical protein